MKVHTQSITYQDTYNETLIGYAAWDQQSAKKPVVLIAHDWSGCNDFAKQKAEEIAQLGYIGFAMDLYGNGRIGKSKEEKNQLMQPLLSNRAHLLIRLKAALDALNQLTNANLNLIAGIGFCFGGLAILDLARSGAKLQGVVSFHGALSAPTSAYNSKINAKILALHGYSDPMVPIKDVLAFAEEMTAANADWQLHAYGHTLHAFTNPEANDPAFGTVYNKTADQRSWQTMKTFLEEVFA